MFKKSNYLPQVKITFGSQVPLTKRFKDLTPKCNSRVRLGLVQCGISVTEVVKQITEVPIVKDIDSAIENEIAELMREDVKLTNLSPSDVIELMREDAALINLSDTVHKLQDKFQRRGS